MQEIYDKVLKEKLFIEQLNNGLTLMMMPRKGFNKYYGIFATNYGSIDNRFINPESGTEERVSDGIAHFLEHKLFEGKTEDTFTRFARLGASTNAFTNYHMTAYLFKTTDNFLESTLTLLDFVQDPYLTDENVKKEKGIIAQEIKMYEDEANYQVYLNLLNGLFHKHPVKIDIAGTVESINQISKEELELCYNTFYNPANMALFLTGDFQIEEIVESIEKDQAKKNFKTYDKIKRIYPDEPETINKALVTVNMDVSEPLFRLGIKESMIPQDIAMIVKQEMATEMLIDLLIGKSSKLYQDLYDQGLIDDKFNHYYVLEKSYGYLLMGGKTKNTDLLHQKIIEGFKSQISNIKKESFERVYKKNLGEYIETYNSFESVASEFISYYFKGINYFQLLEIMQEIDLQYLLERFEQLFDEGKIVRSIITA
ncbi:MAG: EF-P 5-aminopentanol modification-associated protein YfmH [bacterium]